MSRQKEMINGSEDCLIEEEEEKGKGEEEEEEEEGTGEEGLKEEVVRTAVYH